MENYRLKNKIAWEEAFNNRSENFDKTLLETIVKNPKKLFTPAIDELFSQINTNSKTLGQFCCNNGRETLAALSYGFKKVIGFDIAENMMNFANEIAALNTMNASFYATDLLALDDTHINQFDVGLFTVGALCWFEDLNEVFKTVSKTIKNGGLLIIEDMHPFGNMMAETSHEVYSKNYPKNIAFDYFKSTPWIETSGMGYMTNKTYESSVFTSYSHTLSSIINGLYNAGFIITHFEENDIDQGNIFTHLNKQGMPLTYVLKAQKIK
jgi:SAM-dependent methyltransferase